MPRTILAGAFIVVIIVSVDDASNQLVAHDVFATEFAEVHSVDSFEDVAHDLQSAVLTTRQVYLADVTGNDHFGAEP